MTKISLELEDIKALASDSRLEILKALDGKRLNLTDITKITNLKKPTLHAHLTKLLEAEFIKKKTRKGHKWVYYTLTWKGECLLHPENTKIIMLFSIAFVSFAVGIIQLLSYAKGTIIGFAETQLGMETTQIYAIPPNSDIPLFSQNAFENIANVTANNQTLNQLSNIINNNGQVQGLAGNRFTDEAIQWAVSPQNSNLVATIQDPTYMYIGIVCLAVFMIFLLFGIWRLWESRKTDL